MTLMSLPPDTSPVRVAWAGARAQWRSFVFAVIGASAYGILTVVTARVVGSLIQQVITPAVQHHTFTGSMAWRITWQLGGVVLLNVIAVIIRRIAAGIAYNNLIATTRQHVTRAYLDLPMAWHQKRSAGELLSNANSDVEITWNIFQPLPMALGVAVMLAYGIVSIFLVDVTLGFVASIIFPALIVINYWFQRVMRQRVEASQKARADVSGVADESFDGALIVKALGKGDAETARFATATTRLRDANIAVGRTEGVFDPITSALPTIGSLLVVLVGARRVAAGDLSAGQVVEVAYLFNLLAWPVRAFGWILFSLPQVSIGWRRVKSNIDDACQLRTTPGDRVVATPPAVSVRGLGWADEAGAIVTDVNFDIPAGSTIALVGASGSGKSTVAWMLAGLREPTQGEIQVDGVRLDHVQPDAVAIATQDAFIFNTGARDNVTLGRNMSDEHADEALRIAHADGFIQALPQGKEEILGERGSKLSGGQRQRVALARALAGEPGLLILDDATSAIDPAVEGEILRNLRARKTQATTVIVAHRKSSILLADQVVYLDGGEVHARGTHDELMASEAGYRALLTAYDHETNDEGGEA